MNWPIPNIPPLNLHNHNRMWVWKREWNIDGLEQWFKYGCMK